MKRAVLDPHYNPLCQGNTRDFFYQTNVGDMDFKYAKEYGLVWRMGDALGVKDTPNFSKQVCGM